MEEIAYVPAEPSPVQACFRQEKNWVKVRLNFSESTARQLARILVEAASSAWSEEDSEMLFVFSFFRAKHAESSKDAKWVARKRIYLQKEKKY